MNAGKKDLFTATALFLTIIILMPVALWFFNPAPMLFSEDFENTERNKQYTPCAAFTIEQGRLRVTVAQSYSGCSVQIPNEYEEFTFTASVYPVEDVHDGSINILFGQAEDYMYEVQYRPKEEQVNVIHTVTNSNEERVIWATSGWVDVSGTTFYDSENKIELVVTRRSFDLWINNSPTYQYMYTADNEYLKGGISIGAGAGEVGGIAFEFDNIEIHEKNLFPRWIHDYWVIQKLKK